MSKGKNSNIVTPVKSVFKTPDVMKSVPKGVQTGSVKGYPSGSKSKNAPPQVIGDNRKK